MALTARNAYSDEITQAELGQTAAPLKANEHTGRRRVARFSWTSTALASGSNIMLCRLPAGARILAGVIMTGALGTSVTGKVGLSGANATGYIDSAESVSDDDDKFVGATAMATASQTPFAATLALGYGYELSKDCYLTLTTGGATLTAGIAVAGDVTYVLD